MSLKPPTDYMLCLNSACANAGHCLRHHAFLNAPRDTVTLRVLSPFHYPSGESKCPHYNTMQKITVAWGVKDFFKNLPYEIARQIKQELLSSFGRTKYYRFFREERPILPPDQERIQKIFLKNGVESPPAYTRLSEDFDWQ